MTVTNDKVPDFYRYADLMDEDPGCFQEGKNCYCLSMKGRAEMWDNQREAFYKGDYRACTGWSLLQRGAWLVGCVLAVPTKLCIAGSSLASALCCLGCGTFCGVGGCARSVICCCDEASIKTTNTALACLALSGVCCCVSGCACGECVEEVVVDIPTIVIPECSLSLNLLGCLHQQKKISEGLNEKIKDLTKTLS